MAVPLTYRPERLAGYMKVKGGFGCRAQEMVELRIMKGGSRSKARSWPLISLDYTGHLKDLLGKMPGDMVVVGRKAQES